MDAASGAVGAVSFGVSESIIILVVVLLLAFGAWKLAKLIWAALS